MVENNNVKTKDLDFEKCMSRLDEIILKLESPEVKLNDAIGLFDEGVLLVNNIKKTLASAKLMINNSVKKINPVEE